MTDFDFFITGLPSEYEGAQEDSLSTVVKTERGCISWNCMNKLSLIREQGVISQLLLVASETLEGKRCHLRCLVVCLKILSSYWRAFLSAAGAELCESCSAASVEQVALRASRVSKVCEMMAI